ncbi:hypothetical protein DXG01_003664 [Tephrocybe rancida]|nr:hypothetical protein DXG01_003664 [Tephrocybe rancida]
MADRLALRLGVNDKYKIYPLPTCLTSERAMPTNDTDFIPQAPSGPSANAPGIRNYDYTFKYPRDKRGEEHRENARVWNVYLDEAEIYDAEMIQGFRNVLDGLLVFAALFSAIVTTFVAQTSQALQPDNAQITVSLLIETNLLLRAAGNGTTLNAIPHGLSPGATTYTTTDAWVNGLFFSSLSLSLSSALLTVLAKQWIQISSPTCWIASGILVVTMFFYFATPILSVVYVESPFRVPILMYMTMKGTAMALVWFARLRRFFGRPVSSRTGVRILKMHESLQDMERRAVFYSYPYRHPSSTILDGLKWLTDQTTNQSVGEIVGEAATGLLMEETIDTADWFDKKDPNFIPKSKLQSFYCFLHSELIHSCIRTLELNIWATDSGHDPNNIATWENLIQIIFKAASDGYLNTMPVRTCFATADHLNDIALCTRILDWTAVISFRDWDLESFSGYIGSHLGAAGAQAFLRKFPHLLDKLFHQAAGGGNMKVVTAIVDDHPSVISIRDANNKTALEHAASYDKFDVVDFLLQRGAERPPHLLHQLLRGLLFVEALHLLERGWNPFLEDESETSAFELANRLNDDEDGALHQPDDSVEDRERRTCALGDVLEKMKLMKGEQSNPD